MNETQLVPETRYTRSGDVNIAYQVVGDGPRDLVLVLGWVTHVEYIWEEPSAAAFLKRLASFSRLILFDKRGTGLSDRVPNSELPTLEQRMDDVRAVMDAAGSERAALMGVSEGGPMCLLFAATHPQRTTALILIGSYARRMWAPDHQWATPPEEGEAFLKEIAHDWGGPVGLDVRAPSELDNEAFRRWWATYLRMSASPGAAETLTRMNGLIDVRHVLPAVRVPTLILHAEHDRSLSVEHGRYVAQQIEGARYVEVPSDDHLPWVGDQDAILDEVEEFLTGARRGSEPDRVLATVLFTDIVGSTQRAVQLGDRRWHALLTAHETVIRRELERFRGHEIDTAGDGFLATFDGPARAIRCAVAIRDGVHSIGLTIRAGLHTGECELHGGNIAGIAVHTGARVAALAGPDEVLVSSTVKDLVAGSGIGFEDRGVHELKGVPGSWRIFGVLAA
jgi:pimeloyl-ACP methyl ester carboxylesterase